MCAYACVYVLAVSMNTCSCLNVAVRATKAACDCVPRGLPVLRCVIVTMCPCDYSNKLDVDTNLSVGYKFALGISTE